MDRLGKDMSNIALTPNVSQSLNAAAKQLDIFQIAANPK